MRWRVRVISGPGAGLAADVDGALVIGRAGAGLDLPSPAISRAHLRVSARPAGLLVEDLGSRNGTHVDGAPVERAVSACDGTRIVVGPSVLRVEAVPEAAASGRDVIAAEPVAAGRMVPEEGPGGREAGREGSAGEPPSAPGRPRAAVPPALRRRLPLLAAAVAAVGLLSAAALACGERGPATPATPRNLADVEADEVFTVGPAAPAHAFRFETPAPSTRLALRYARIAGPGAAAVELNGVVIGDVPASSAWEAAPELVLPAALLRAENRLRLVGNGGGEARLGELRLVADRLPGCEPASCLRRAAELHALGERAARDRAVAPDNLFRAERLLREALLHLELVAPPVELHARARRLRDEVARDLDRSCRALRLEALRQVHLGRWEEAAAGAAAMIRHFPGAEHPCHRAGRRLLDRLAEDR